MSYKMLVFGIQLLQLLLVLSPLTSGQTLFRGLCPERCDCGLDERGRMEISCIQGRMTEIPTIKMSQSTEVIRVMPPESQPNHLTIGRFFRQFKKLEELHIVNSNIPNIGEHSFWGVQSLRTLNLAQNNISLIVDSNFKGLVSLEILNLSHNKISSFVSASFLDLVSLRELDLSWNLANKLVERLFYKLHMLESLDLSGNWVRELSPDVFRDTWRLKILRCRACGLKAINPLLYALLAEIKILDLGQNEFKYLTRQEFGSLIHLRQLYLDGNQLSAIVDEVFHSQNFYRLSLASNLIVEFGLRAFENTTIGELDLSGNQFDTLHIMTLGPATRRNLSSLDLSRNPKLKMASLSLVLEINPQLVRLGLAENKYEEVPLTLFEKLERLEFLNISGNQLVDLYPQQLTMLRRLRVLDASGNRLKGIDGDILAYIDSLSGFQDLRLTGNPFSCDLCNIPILLKWIQIHPKFTRGCNNYGPYCLRCASPPALYDRELSTIEEDMLDWCKTAEPASILASDPKFGLFLGCGVILMMLVAAAIAIILHSRWHAAHYYTHEEDRPEIGTPPIPPDYDHLATNEGFDNLYFENNGNKPKMIATIEEMVYDPGFVVTTTNPVSAINGGIRKSSYPPPLSSFKAPPPPGGRPSSNPPAPPKNCQFER